MAFFYFDDQRVVTREYWHDQNLRSLILNICDGNEVR